MLETSNLKISMQYNMCNVIIYSLFKISSNKGIIS